MRQYTSVRSDCSKDSLVFYGSSGDVTSWLPDAYPTSFVALLDSGERLQLAGYSRLPVPLRLLWFAGSAPYPLMLLSKVMILSGGVAPSQMC